jgi:glutamate racemase
MDKPAQHELPIGVFDSGLGGLTVARAIRTALPCEDVLYLGDTARVPYGARSPGTILRYARGCARVLEQRGVKVLVVACNTVSAVALEMLRVELDMPVMGVIEPGARAAVEASRSHRIGVMGTASTVASGAYPRAVAALSSRAEVFPIAAPLLVPLAEEGWLDGDVPRLAVERYMAALSDRGIDTLVLGCTHYPMLRSIIEQVARVALGDAARVVDSAEATARELARFLPERALHARGERAGRMRVMVTDRPQAFADIASRFLGHVVEDVEVVDL